MITFFNPHHALHQGKLEMFRGQLVPCFEVPARVDHVLAELQRRNLGPVQAPQVFDDAVLTTVHAPRYLDFLANAWHDWVALDPDNAERDALPSVWPIRTFRADVVPDNFAARIAWPCWTSTTTMAMARRRSSTIAPMCCLPASMAIR